MTQFDPATKALQDAIYRSKVARAREQSVSEKFFAGPRMFDGSCQRMRSGIRHQFPEYTDEQVEAELKRRLKIKRLIDERGIYVDAGYLDE